MAIQELNQNLAPEDPQKRVKHRRSTIVDAPDGDITFEKQDVTVKSADGYMTQTMSSPVILPEGHKVSDEKDITGQCSYARKRHFFSKRPRCGYISKNAQEMIDRCPRCGRKVCPVHSRIWFGDGQRYCLRCRNTFLLFLPIQLLWKVICWIGRALFDFFNNDEMEQGRMDHEDHPVFVGDDHVDGDEAEG